MTWRELQSLLGQLPQGNRLAVSLFGERLTWSRLEYMVATLIDAVENMRYEAKSMNPRVKNAGPPPRPYPRPERDRAKELAPRLAQWRARHGEGDRRGR